MKADWISVSVAYPEEHHDVLVVVDGRIEVSQWHNILGHPYWDGCEDWSSEPTHWMALPELPVADKNEI